MSDFSRNSAHYEPREISLTDRIISAFDGVLRHTAGVRGDQVNNQINYPAGNPGEENLSFTERQHAAALMRVNHVGEVCAQALYTGQALVARDPAIADVMQSAAKEELAHLRWCEKRIEELGGHKSYLNPLWAGGSIIIGVLAGIAGDKKSLGFVEETENQVCDHLTKHLDDLPASDQRSRAVVAAMREDEARHATRANELGAVPVPPFIKLVMKAQAKLMTTIAYRI